VSDSRAKILEGNKVEEESEPRVGVIDPTDEVAEFRYRERKKKSRRNMPGGRKASRKSKGKRLAKTRAKQFVGSVTNTSIVQKFVAFQAPSLI
jgi:hypothetical protein